MAAANPTLAEGDITTTPIDELSPHPKNSEIYDNGDVSELVEKMNEYGFKAEHRLLVTGDGTILSGHRRWEAAKQVGIESVPVEVTNVEDDDEALLRILLANRYREKTKAERIKEGEAWEEIEREQAEKRNSKSGGSSVEKLPQTETGKTRDKVGEKIGLSGKSYEKGKEVKDRAEKGDETAKKEWEKLEDGEQSIHGAFEETVNDGPEMKTFQFEMVKEKWEEWTNTVPRQEPLDSRLRTLIRQDANAAQLDDVEASEMDARLAGTRIRVQAMGALSAVRDRDDPETAREKLSKIVDIANTLESA